MVEQIRIYYLFPDAPDSAGDDLLSTIWDYYQSSSTESDRSVADTSGPPDRTTGPIRITNGEISAHVRWQSDTDAATAAAAPAVPHLRVDISEYHMLRGPLDSEVIDEMKPAYTDRVDQIVEMVTDLYTLADPRPSVVYGLDKGFLTVVMEGTADSPPVTVKSLAADQLEYIPWLVILPPAIIEHYGRETLLETPAKIIDELDDGSILLMSFQDVLYMTDGPPLSDIYEHLGMESPLPV